MPCAVQQNRYSVMKIINTPLEKEKIINLKVGDKVLLSGVIYTCRDLAHKRLVENINQAKRLPISIKGQILYYCGPTKRPRGKVIGACGPTTSSRLDEFTPALLSQGLAAMIGKGKRSKQVVKAIKRYRGVYFLTYAGCGALLSKYIKKAKLKVYKALGPEAIYELRVRNFPLIVGIDSRGRSVYGKG